MNLCSIFVSIIIGFVTLPENMTVINAVPAGTDIKLIVLMLLIMLLKDVYCICLAVYSCTEFSSVQFAWYFWLQVPPYPPPELSVPITNVL